jgi:hypothetical protein
VGSVTENHQKLQTNPQQKKIKFCPGAVSFSKCWPFWADIDPEMAEITRPFLVSPAWAHRVQFVQILGLFLRF